MASDGRYSELTDLMIFNDIQMLVLYTDFPQYESEKLITQG